MRRFYLIFLILILGISSAFSQEVKVEINPRKPVAGEVFQAIFRVFTDSSEDPAINFSPSGLEVVGKTNQGVSTRTIYENGKLTVTREVMIVYELSASQTGTAYLRDITVQVGPKTIKHPQIAISILKEAEVMAEMFVMADVPKKSLFLGEGVMVRYFLYSKVSVNNIEVKKYPKLDNFLKRFLQEPERNERVSMDGQVYMRVQIYSAKLFPEKIGELKIDPLSLTATFPVTRPGDPFGSFGMGREFKTKTLNSESVIIQVKTLPQPVPTHFTGLVGKHDFNLEFNQTKMIVNEPLNVKLTITGGGALENLEAPTLVKNQALEEFESNGELKITDPNSATKIFDYTFLAKENLQLPSSKIQLSYLDPDSGRYVPTELSIPEITIAGGSDKVNSPEKDEPEDLSDEKKPKNVVKKAKPFEFSNPLVSDQFQFRQILPYLNAGLATLALVFALGFFIKQKNVPSFHKKVQIPVSFKKGQFSFSELVRWMSPLIDETGKSPATIIRESKLDQESKKYFLDLLSSSDQKEYSSSKSGGGYSYNPKHFKKLGSIISRVENEDS